MSKIVLKSGREKLLARMHPWIFSGAIAKVIGNPDLGDTVEVCDSSGKVRAKAAYSPNSQIRARIWSFDVSENIDTVLIIIIITSICFWFAQTIPPRFFKNSSQIYVQGFFRTRIRSAINLRCESMPSLPDAGNNAMRLIHGENDGLPGLVVDRYHETLVVQVPKETELCINISMVEYSSCRRARRSGARSISFTLKLGSIAYTL
jgi:23S rRNA (cytosine1962-C5)-methyltransferase